LDGWGVYRWHGVSVPADVVLSPGSITVARIDAEKNAEVRRVMLERFGASRYILESGTQAISEDRYGRLYRREIQGDEPIVMVRVINSTPEGTWTPSLCEICGREAVEWCAPCAQAEIAPGRLVPELRDGVPYHKEYWLRVHPELRPMLPDGSLGQPQALTAHAAVASTFGLRAEEYHPDVET
jgi:hypothetical protein